MLRGIICRGFEVWLFLEEKRIPYSIAKVTMRCYGPKERWYLAKAVGRRARRSPVADVFAHRRRGE